MCYQTVFTFLKIPPSVAILSGVTKGLFGKKRGIKKNSESELYTLYDVAAFKNSFLLC